MNIEEIFERDSINLFPVSKVGIVRHDDGTAWIEQVMKLPHDAILRTVAIQLHDDEFDTRVWGWNMKKKATAEVSAADYDWLRDLKVSWEGDCRL